MKRGATTLTDSLELEDSSPPQKLKRLKKGKDIQQVSHFSGGEEEDELSDEVSQSDNYSSEESYHESSPEEETYSHYPSGDENYRESNSEEENQSPSPPSSPTNIEEKSGKTESNLPSVKSPSSKPEEDPNAVPTMGMKKIEFLKQFLGQERPTVPKPPGTSISFAEREESDDEGEMQTTTSPPQFINPFIQKGVEVKLLANVYLRRLHEAANIFVPYYCVTYRDATGVHRLRDYFRTKSRKICVFASGGLQNYWEKTVSTIYDIFFGGEKVKVIRAFWIQKHLYKDLKIQRNFEEEFKGRENELHSEFYYDLFFKHFFLPELETMNLKPEAIDIFAFSWWDVCNQCDQTLGKQKTLPSLQNVRLKYYIAANRRYCHSYPNDTLITSYRIRDLGEQDIWTQIWDKVTVYVQKPFPTKKAKKHFWTKTPEGLEVCKWLAQGLEENMVTLDGQTTKPSKKGDILKFYRKMSDKDTQGLRDLLDYLKEVNWELSCWYKGYYPDNIVLAWKKHWRQMVLPLFGWEEVELTRDDQKTTFCEMCGNTDVVYISWAFHPKFNVSKKFLSYSEEDQKRSERQEGYNLQTPFGALPPVLQQKRRQSLCVGSECVKVLEWYKEKIDAWRAKKQSEDSESKWKDQIVVRDSYAELDRAEKELKKKMRKN